MKRWRFYIGWIDGSYGACGDSTGIHTADDLVEGNEHVNVFEYEAPEGFEWQVGASMAFRENFTGQDTASRVEEIQ